MAMLDDIRKKAEEAAGNINPEDVAAGAELASEAVKGAVDKVAADIGSMTPEDLAAGAELVKEAVTNAVQKAAK